MRRPVIPVRGASKQITDALLTWDGIESHPHRFGGTEFRIGKREIGHVHGDSLVDIPFPKKVRDEIVAAGEAKPHHVLPDSGWVSFYFKEEADIEKALALLKRSYEIAGKQKRPHAGSFLVQPEQALVDPQSKSKPGILVRNAVMDEAQAIASVLRLAFVEYERSYTPEGFAATTPTADQIRARWEEGPVWVAMNDEEVVGTVAAAPRSLGLYVRSMAVLPSARGQGIAGALLREVELFAIDNYITFMFLSTTPFLHKAIHLYERFGFQRSIEGEEDLFGTPLFRMVKPLRVTDQAVQD